MGHSAFIAMDAMEEVDTHRVDEMCAHIRGGL
jgi:hypothetical protein